MLAAARLAKATLPLWTYSKLDAFERMQAARSGYNRAWGHYAACINHRMPRPVAAKPPEGDA
jgi:hypothetical protein